MKEKLSQKAYQWLARENGEGFLDSQEYCQTRDIFQARLEKLKIDLEKNIKDLNLAYLLIIVMGEIGNNSFDHNLGKWQDIPGIFFCLNIKEKIAVLADRGQGILSSLKQVMPEIKQNKEALEIAFTQIISGRSPEKRGNGLKFVAKVAQENEIEVFLHSGNASAKVNKQKGLQFQKEKLNVKGTLSIIRF